MTNDALFRAIGWTLVHSLWQATLAALLLLLIVPRLKNARQRYWTAYAFLLLVLFAAVATCISVYNPAKVADSAVGVLDTTLLFIIENQSINTSIGQIFSNWLEANHTMLVVLWLLGFGFFLLRLIGGLWQVQMLKRHGIVVPSQDWQEKFDSLRKSLGLRGNVRLFESNRVNMPMAMGWLKPVVLLPIGMVNQLTPSEVEAVLAHELAHIARRDWVFNLIQAFIESLFYYHPAVWWISSVIRRERENSCDDAALQTTGNPMAFAKALVQVQEMANAVPALALGLSDKRRRPLLERVRRILNQPQQKQQQVMEKITATIILLACLALVGLKANSGPALDAVFSQISTFPDKFMGKQVSDNQMQNDTTPKRKTTKIVREEDDQVVKAEYQDGKLTRLNIDGEEIPESEFASHKYLTDELMEEAPSLPTPPSPPSNFWHSEDGRVWSFPTPPTPPDAPRAFWFGTDAPKGFSSPHFREDVQVYTDEDKDGNTIIRLNNNGESTEVIVKDDDVYINGKKVEKGDSINIPGLQFFNDKNIFFAPEGFNYRFDFDDSNESRAFLFDRYSEHMDDKERAIAMEQRALAMKERVQAMKEVEKELKQHQKEMRRSQQDVRRYQREAERELREVQRARDARVEYAPFYSRNNSVEKLLKKQLVKDGLISDPENFSFEINDKKLKVNKKKQSEPMRKKYMELLEGQMGIKSTGKTSFNFNYSNK